ncbi:MAG: D-alanine--D-alanine ligase A [Acidobacteria bacterium RBG_13_68_16]|jgi:D-alanine-D-alanine ligase|nr:MAG: D-alanine--D-alanine ligase A [Acidobacteria bacterium RBG_13_68_16]
MSAKLRVALVFGGRSGEHEVSVVSARSVAAALDRQRYEIIPMAIDRAGLWADPAVAARVLTEAGASPDRVPGFEGAARLDQRLLDGAVDVVLPILHGPFGEDGTIQGMCEMLDLPYVGCDVESSAVTMDKVTSKRLFRQAGLPTPRWATVSTGEWNAERSACEERCLALPLPLFVKPARLGSSVGIAKVKQAGDLAPAVEVALGYDSLVIVEEGIPGREIEVSVLGGEPPFVSVPGEIVPGHEFYDYADKYLEDSCQLLAPATLEPGQVAEVQRLALAAFATLGCEGMARADFLLDGRDGRILISELNSIPGFTAISMYPRLLGLSGVSYPRLLDALITLALDRHERRRRFAEAALRPLSERSR